MGYAKEINKMTFSFSREHLWEQCPYAFYCKYIEHRDGESNFYASNGKIMHSIFEGLLKHEISIDEAASIYQDEFDLVCETTKASTMENTFNKCMDYLCAIDEIDESKYEIIGVELKLDFKIGKYDFVGYADCVLREIETERIILIDHKSADGFFKKDNITPLKNQEESFKAYKHQMYIYCKGLKECFGYDVDTIVWHHFKQDGKLSIIQFNKEEYEETLKWAIETIEKIKKDNVFNCNKSYMMCYQLCDFRNDCEYKDEE